MYQLSLDKPPAFRADSFATWRNKIEAWREIHCTAPERTLVGAIVTDIVDPTASKLLRTFMKDTRDDIHKRTLDAMYKRLSPVYGIRKDITEYEKIKRWQAIERRNNESIRDFTARFEEGT